MVFLKIILKGSVHSFNIRTISLEDGSLMTVLMSRFSPNVPVGPVIFKLVFYRSNIFGSNVTIFGSLITIFGSLVTIYGSLVIT